VVATLRGDRRNRKSPGIYLLDLAADASIRRLGEGLYPRLRWSPTGNVLAIDLSYNTISLLDEDGEALGEPRGGIHAGDVIWGERGETFHAAGLLPLEQPVSMDRLRLRSQLVRWQAGAWEVMRQVEGYLTVRRITPNGRWLILASEETGDRELVAASTDGRFWLSLTEHPADDESAMPVPRSTGR
jgi:hypothetical protein